MAQGNKKAISPYNRLLKKVREFVYEARFRRTKIMFGKLQKNGTYDWETIYHRMMAADQIGYEVLIVPDDEYGYFKIIYREKFPIPPYEFIHW